MFGVPTMDSRDASAESRNDPTEVVSLQLADVPQPECRTPGRCGPAKRNREPTPRHEVARSKTIELTPESSNIYFMKCEEGL
jgi:hypothetical protein